MTMLDRMRRHKNWLKWSLAIVVLTFVLLYIPDFVQTTPTGTGAGPREVVAEINGRTVTAGDFQQRYLSQVQAYRQQFGGSMNDQLLRQLGIDQQILSQMIDEQVGLIEAEQNGISVSDDELAPADLLDPGTPGKRAVHRRAALRATAAKPEPADDEVAVRRAPAPQHGARQAARRADRLDGGVRRRRAARVQAAQREGETAGRGADGGELPQRCHRDRRRRGGALRGAQGRIPHRRAAEDQVPAARSRSGAPEDLHSADRHPALLQRQHPAVPDAGTGQGEPHPAQDRGQGRSHRPQAGRRRSCSRSRAAATSPRWPRSTRKTKARRPTAATSTTSAAAAWCRNSRTRPSPCNRARSATS